MIRLHKENINSAEYFDSIWNLKDVHKYDIVRLNALLKNVKRGDSICELGSGLFSFAQYALAVVALNVQCTVVDFSPVAIAKCKVYAPKINAIVGNVLTTPFEDNSFDMVGASEVIEHMERPEDLVKEMARICKSKGFLEISTVDPDCEDAKKLEYPEHLWRFTVQELKDYFIPYGDTSYNLVGDYHMITCEKK
jgi:ubiquinone/menaquinone biosynthesis C-methylase UbiE